MASSEGWGCHPTVKTLTRNCLLGRAWGKENPATSISGIQLKGRPLRLDTITEAMKHAHKGTYHDCPLTNSWKSQMQIFAPNQWTEAADHCCWIRERLKEAKDEGYPVGRPAVSINMDLWDLSNTGQPNRQHIPADMRPQTYIQKRNSKSLFIQRWCI